MHTAEKQKLEAVIKVAEYDFVVGVGMGKCEAWKCNRLYADFMELGPYLLDPFWKLIFENRDAQFKIKDLTLETVTQYQTINYLKKISRGLSEIIYMQQSDEILKKRFSFHLRKALKEKKITQKDFATDIEVTPIYVSNWMHQRKFPSWELYCAVCNYFEKDFTYFLRPIKQKKAA